LRKSVTHDLIATLRIDHIPGESHEADFVYVENPSYFSVYVPRCRCGDGPGKTANNANADTITDAKTTSE
jgi:hypothetical protein